MTFSKIKALEIVKKEYPFVFTPSEETFKLIKSKKLKKVFEKMLEKEMIRIIRVKEAEKQRKIRKIQNEKRERKMISMKEKGDSFEEIGQHFNISRERVRQILFEFGITGTTHPIKSKRVFVKVICAKCKGSFSTYQNARRKYCSPICYKTDNVLNKPMKDWTKEDRKEYDKIRNYSPASIKARKRYYKEHKEEIYEQNRKRSKTPEFHEWVRKYNSRPEVKARIKARIKYRFATDPEFRERIREHGRKAYNKIKDNPEFREKKRAYSKKYYLEKIKNKKHD